MATRVRQFVIHGVTESGSRFRPSDWAERLAGNASPFRPPGCAGNHLTYSPYVLPVVIDGVRHRGRPAPARPGPLAYKFVVDFAHDSHLKTEEREVDPDGAGSREAASGSRPGRAQPQRPSGAFVRRWRRPPGRLRALLP